MSDPNVILTACIRRQVRPEGFCYEAEVMRRPGPEPGPLIDALIAALKRVRRAGRETGAGLGQIFLYPVEIEREPAGEP